MANDVDEGPRESRRRSFLDTVFQDPPKVSGAQAGQRKSSLKKEDEDDQEDDGSHIRNLIIALEEAVAKSNRRRGAVMRGSLLGQVKEHKSTAEALITCLDKVREMNNRSKMQYRLQDMILDWLMAPKMLVQATPIDIRARIDERKGFWAPFRSNCTKWELGGDLGSQQSKKSKKEFDTLHTLSKGCEKVGSEKAKKGGGRRMARGAYSDAYGARGAGMLESVLYPLDPMARDEEEPRPKDGHNHRKVTVSNKDTACCKMCATTNRCFVKGDDIQPRWRRKKPERHVEQELEEDSDYESEELHRKSFYDTEPQPEGMRADHKKQVKHERKVAEDSTALSNYSTRSKRLQQSFSLPALSNASHVCDVCEEKRKGSKEKSSVPKLMKRFPGLNDPVRSLGHYRSPQHVYFAACEKQNMLPRVPACLLGNSVSTAITLQRQNLLDCDLRALVEPLRKGNVEVLDLSENQFTDEGISDFMGELNIDFLTKLDVSFAGASECAVGQISMMLCTGCPRLAELDLGGIVLSDSACKSLCDSLAAHGQLTSLGLRDSQLGRMSQGCFVRVAALLVKMPVLQKLDLSGNFMFHEGCDALVEALSQTESLTDLDLSHNASSYILPPKRKKRVTSDKKSSKSAQKFEEVPNFSPMLLFCEGISKNSSLHKLRLASTMLDFSADFTLAISLEGHPKLEYLDLSSNPHGEDGLRALLRLLMPPQCRIVYCDISDCRDSRATGIEVGVDFTDPRGHYDLDLRHPRHRCIARFLLERASRDPEPIETLFEKVCMDPPLKKGENWFWKQGRCWEMPQTGSISFDFVIMATIDKQLPPAEALKQYNRARRIFITMGRFVTLFSMYSGLRAAEQRGLLIGAIADQLLLKMCHFQKFLKVSPELVELIVNKLYAAVESMDRLAIFDLLKRREESKRFRKVARSHFFFNQLSCTDHYELDLSSPTDRLVADSLSVMNLYEMLPKGAIDTTQHGYGEGVRNAIWEQCHEIKHFASASLPARGILSLDYVSPNGPSSKALPVSDSSFESIVSIYESSECCHEDRIRALRVVAHQLVIAPDQMYRLCKEAFNPTLRRRSSARLSFDARMSLRGKILRAGKKLKAMNLLGLNLKESAFQYRDTNPRIEMFICFFNRCMHQQEICNKSCLYNPSVFSQVDSHEIQRRLGILRTFDAYECHCKDTNCGNRFKLDLALHEDWCLGRFLVTLAAIEDGENMTKCEYSKYQFMTRQGYDFLVPNTWVKELPTDGVFTLNYVEEKEEYRLPKERRRLAEEWCGWEVA